MEIYNKRIKSLELALEFFKYNRIESVSGSETVFFTDELTQVADEIYKYIETGKVSNAEEESLTKASDVPGVSYINSNSVN